MAALSIAINEQAKELGTDREHNDKEISQSVWNKLRRDRLFGEKSFFEFPKN